MKTILVAIVLFVAANAFADSVPIGTALTLAEPSIVQVELDSTFTAFNPNAFPVATTLTTSDTIYIGGQWYDLAAPAVVVQLPPGEWISSVEAVFGTYAVPAGTWPLWIFPDPTIGFPILMEPTYSVSQDADWIVVPEPMVVDVLGFAVCVACGIMAWRCVVPKKI